MFGGTRLETVCLQQRIVSNAFKLNEYLCYEKPKKSSIQLSNGAWYGPLYLVK